MIPQGQGSSWAPKVIGLVRDTKELVVERANEHLSARAYLVNTFYGQGFLGMCENANCYSTPY